MNSYRELKVSQMSMDLVVEAYRVAKLLPRTELFGLVSQIQRAAVLIAANIAKGHGREHLGDYLRHLSVASGSLIEVETHLLMVNLLYLPMEELKPAQGMVREIDRMLSGLVKKLKELPEAA